MAVWPPLIASCVLTLAVHPLPTLTEEVPRVKRQEADPISDEEYAVDYAGNENNDDTDNNDDNFNNNNNNDDAVVDAEVDTFRDRFKDTQNDDFNEDRFGTDTFDDAPAEKETEKSKEKEESEESKPKKKVKKHKYLKKTLDFLKRVLDPNKLMENAYVTEMLRRFSHHEEPEYEERESSESEEELPPPPVMKKRRGRPRKKDKIPPGITGMLRKGVMSLTKIELDKKKLKRRVKLIKRLARKAKKPLKTAVKIFLSSRNQGGYGGGGYANNY